MNELSAFEVKELRKKAIMEIPGVVGIGISRGSGNRINIYVKEKTPELLEKIPKVIDGLPVLVVECGEIKALQLFAEELPKAYLAEREKKVRPAVPGVSIGNFGILCHNRIS